MHIARLSSSVSLRRDVLDFALIGVISELMLVAESGVGIVIAGKIGVG